VRSIRHYRLSGTILTSSADYSQTQLGQAVSLSGHAARTRRPRSGGRLLPGLRGRDFIRCWVRAVDSGFRAWARGTAIVDLDGFEEVWRVTRSIPGWLNEENAAAMWAVIQERRPRNIVEIGSYLGRSTVLLGLSAKATGDAMAKVTAIDPHTGDRQQLEKLGIEELPTLTLFNMHIRAAGLDHIVHPWVAKSDEVAGAWSDPIDLLYVDGWHSYEAVCADARNFAKWLSPSGLVCFDDFAAHSEVRQAVFDSCSSLGLTLYGSVFGQAWAGRLINPPASLARAMRVTRICPVGGGEALRSVRRHVPGSLREHL
jgi:predicted O-methyltransferase YrrM